MVEYSKDDVDFFNNVFGKLNENLGESKTTRSGIKPNHVEGYDVMETLKEQSNMAPVVDNTEQIYSNPVYSTPINNSIYVISEEDSFSIMKGNEIIAKNFKSKETAHTFKNLLEEGYDLNSSKVFNVLVLERKINKSTTLTESQGYLDKLKKLLS